MVHFNTPTVTYSAKRVYKAIEDFDDYVDVKDKYQADTTMGVTGKKVTAESYATEINIVNAAGVVLGTVSVKAKNTANYSRLVEKINKDFAEEVFEEGCNAVENTDKRNWKMTLSGDSASKDPFHFAVTEDVGTLSGYHEEGTLNTFETWAATVPALNGEPTA